MDREKVIKWLNVCKTSHYAVRIEEDYPCRLCPYHEKEYCMKELISDALALLKEQETKTGHWISVNDGDVVAIDDDGFPERACYCSECQKYLIASDEYAVYGRYCPFCGTKMKGR